MKHENETRDNGMKLFDMRCYAVLWHGLNMEWIGLEWGGMELK